MTGKDQDVLECVVNISEGRRHDVLDRLDRAVARSAFLDRHTCAHHNPKYPKLSDLFKEVNSDGMAESLLIAIYGKSQTII